MSTGVELIRERARLLPDEPGVYVYRDDDGQVLYVGKAKGLRKRVGSYARPDRGLERKTAELVLRIAEIDVTITGTETEALLLEEGDAIMCCDTDGRPLLPLPAAYVQQHNLVHIGAHGTVFGAEALTERLRRLRRRL